MSGRQNHGRHDRSRQYFDEDEEGGASKRSRVEYKEYNELVAKEQLEDLIIQLGSNSTIEQHETVQNDVHDLSVVLESESAKFKDAILNVLVACASERPHKLRVYATLVALLNLKNHDFVGEFLERLVKQLRGELSSPSLDTDWSCVLATVRFLSELSGHRVVKPESLLQLYNAFLGVALEEGIPQARSDCFVHLVMAALPWGAGAVVERHRQELAQLMASIDSYRARRGLGHLGAVQSITGQEDWIDSLWFQLQSLERADWKEKCSLRFEAFTAALASPDAVGHGLPALAPQPHEAESGGWYPFPRAVFRLFDYTDVPEDGPALPGEHSIERYLVEEQLTAIIECHRHERRDCAKALLSARFGVRVPLPYMLVELLLGQMLRLPRAEHLQLFYGTLLIELCKEDPDAMPNVVAQATFAMFDRLEGLNAECAGRLAKWFAYHLSQCRYQWSWADWTEECKKLGFAHPKLAFLRDTAQLLVRFSYYDHVRKALGQPLAPMLLHQRQPECTYKFDMEAEHSPDVVACAHRLIDSIRDRCPPDTAIELLNALPAPDGIANGEAHMMLKIDVFFSTLLYLGSKSFSHSFAALAKFHPVCRALVPQDSPGAKRQLLATLYESWRWHEQMLVVLLDKLVKVQLVDCLSVFRWLFGDCGGEGAAEEASACAAPPLPRLELSRGFAWDAAAGVLEKQRKQRDRLHEDWARARRRHDEFQERMRTACVPGAQGGQGEPTVKEVELEAESAPTRDELDTKLARADAASRELKSLAGCLLGCAVWSAGTEGGRIDAGNGAAAGVEGDDRHLRKLVWQRCLALITAEAESLRPAMRDLYQQQQQQQQQSASQQAWASFCDAFFALSD